MLFLIIHKIILQNASWFPQQILNNTAVFNIDNNKNYFWTVLYSTNRSFNDKSKIMSKVKLVSD